MTKDGLGETAEGRRASESTLPLDTVFHALASHRRRMVLYYLTTCMHPIPLEELVDTVALQESETHVGDIPAEVYEEVAVDLHHTQLPKLTDGGIVNHDTDLKLATVAETIRPLDEYLHLAEQYDQK